MDDFVEKIKKLIFTKFYEEHYPVKCAEVTNVVALKKRRQQEETLTAQLISSYKQKLKERKAKLSIENMYKSACYLAVIQRDEYRRKVV